MARTGGGDGIAAGDPDPVALSVTRVPSTACPQWHVYLIECRDGSLYTGVAIDVDRRYAQHVAGKGARYTRAHPPLRLLARFPCADRASACRAEYAVKQLSALQKRALCAGGMAGFEALVGV